MKGKGSKRKRKTKNIIISLFAVSALVLLFLLALFSVRKLGEKFGGLIAEYGRPSEKNDEQSDKNKTTKKKGGSDVKRKTWDEILEWDWKTKQPVDIQGSLDENAEISKTAGEDYLKAAEDFAEHLEERIKGSSDTARFGLFDMDFDGMPELIMHDLTGEYVCYCTYRNESMSERTVLYDNIMNKDFARSCALFDDRNIHLIYEISGGSADGPYREYIKTDVMRLNEAGVQEKIDELMLELVVSGDSIETHYISMNSGDERETDGEEYYSILAGHVGKENADRFRLSDGIPDVIDGDYDFAIGRSEAGTESKQRLTLDELKEVLGSGL